MIARIFFGRIEVGRMGMITGVYSYRFFIVFTRMNASTDGCVTDRKESDNILESRYLCQRDKYQIIRHIRQAIIFTLGYISAAASVQGRLQSARKQQALEGHGT